ncbi:MAG: helix-turn-helix domain-containing protein [Dermatophilaceae bacterium]
MMIGARLRRLREDRGMSREDAGYVIRASESKMSRLESGRVAFKERDVSDLLVLYGVTDPERREGFLDLVRDANRPGWWREYDDVLPGWFNTYIGLEEATARIRGYETGLIPGLLQTEDYARAVLAAAQPPLAREYLDRAVSLRMTRQKIFTRDDPPHVWFVLDEATLHRTVGDRSTRVAQLRHLATVAESGRAVIQVLPLSARVHLATGGSFTILRFQDADLPDLVYIEQLISAHYLDKPQHVDRYTEVMDHLTTNALDPEGSLELLDHLSTRQ